MFILSSGGMSSAVIMASLIELDPLSTLPVHLTYLLLSFVAAMGGMFAAMFLWTDPAPQATRIETYLAEMFRRARASSTLTGSLMLITMFVSLCVVYWFAPWRVLVSSDSTNLTRIAVSPDGRLAASGSLAGEVHVWDLANGTDDRIGRHNSDVVALTFGPDRELWSAGRDGRICFDPIDPERSITLQSPDDLQSNRVYWLEVEGAGRCRAIQGGRWVRYDADTASGAIVDSQLPKLPTFVIEEGVLRWGEFPVVSITPSSDGRWILVATGFRVGLWDAERQQWEWQQSRTDTVYLASFSPNGAGVIVTSTTGLHWLERSTGEERDARKLRSATNVELIPGTNEWLLGDRSRLIRAGAIRNW